VAGYELPARRYYVSTVFSWWPTFADLSLFQKFVSESKQKGMNSVSIDIPWTIEQPNGSYDFTEYDKRIDFIVSQGMSVFIRINTTNIGKQRPKWLTDDMLQRTRDGKIYKRDTDGGTLPSIIHPVVRDHIVKFFRAAATHYGTRYKFTLGGDYPIVTISPAFDLYMESEYFPDADVDYSPTAEADFALWVKTQYKTLDDLNVKWGKKYKNWQDIKLKDAHDTARELYFEFTLQRIFDAIGNAVHDVSKLRVGLQAGCIWDNPHRRTMNVTPLLSKLDWLMIADAPDYDHAFSTDYARCSALGKSVSSEIDTANQATATNGKYFNQGVRAFDHGADAVFVANWDLASMRDNGKWTFLHFVGKMARKPSARPKPTTAIYLSTWDLIHHVVDVEQYISVYSTLSDGGKIPVDVLSDYVIASDPKKLANYSEIHLPANWTIPANVRKALTNVEKKLKVKKPLVAGTLDEYGRPTEPLVKKQ
jgi:hypothetical protein